MKYKYNVLGICFLCTLSIMAYGTYRCNNTNYKDPLTGSLFGPPLNNFLDGWGITHLLFYTALTFAYPSEWLFISAMGVVWEVIEHSVKDKPFYLSKCKYNMETDKGGWWYGRWQDVVMNSLGVVIGHSL